MKNTEYSVRSKFEKLELAIKDHSLICKERLGGEIPFYVFPYKPADNYFVENEISNIKNRLSQAGLDILVIDLFQLVVNILKDRKILDRAILDESKYKKNIFFNNLTRPLDMGLHIAPAIKEIIEKNSPDAVFIKGVGSAFPILRTHNLLNNLQSLVIDMPLILFFPGTYNSHSLKLFDIMSDNYYRAFNLDYFEK